MRSLLLALALPLGAQCQSVDQVSGAALKETHFWGEVPEVSQSRLHVGSIPTMRSPLQQAGVESRRQKTLLLSQFALAGSAALDVRSSWGQRELNPVLGSGTFGARHAAISLGITSIVLLAEWPLVRKFPQSRRVLSYVNFAVAGVRTGVAIHNYGVRQ